MTKTLKQILFFHGTSTPFMCQCGQPAEYTLYSIIQEGQDVNVSCPVGDYCSECATKLSEHIQTLYPNE